MQGSSQHQGSALFLVANACVAFDVQISVVRAMELAPRSRADKAAFPSSKVFRISVLMCVVDGTLVVWLQEVEQLLKTSVTDDGTHVKPRPSQQDPCNFALSIDQTRLAATGFNFSEELFRSL